MALSAYEKELMKTGIVRPLSKTIADRYNSRGRGCKIINNLLTAEYISNTGVGIVAGTGTPVITFDDANNSATITLGEGLTGRGYLAFPTISFVAQNVYCVSFEIVGDYRPGTGTNLLANGSALTVDYGSITVTHAQVTGPGKYACIFSPTTTQNNAFRIGLGVGGNATAPTGGATITIKNPMIQNLTMSGQVIPSGYVKPLTSAAFLSDYQGYLATQTAGKLTLTSNTQYPRSRNRSIAIFGDSYSNDSGDYPAVFRDTYPDFGVWYQYEVTKGNTPAGTKPDFFLTSLVDKMTKLINDGISPGFVFLQSSLNTINNIATVPLQDASIDSSILAIRNAAVWCLEHDMQPILSNIAPWAIGAAADWIGLGMWHAQMRYDTKMYALAAELNLPVFNLRKTLEDPAKPYYMLLANDSGDGIHPNSTGAGLIAQGLRDLMLRLL